jgi:hypothetical protein
MPPFVDIALKLACIIALQTMALVIWNVGARDPLGLLRDVVRVRDARSFFYGAASLLIGLMFVAAATMLVISAIGDAPELFVPLELFTFVVAIAVDALVGNELRRAARL